MFGLCCRGGVDGQIAATIDIGDMHVAGIILLVDIHRDGAKDITRGVVATVDIANGAAVDVGQGIAGDHCEIGGHAETVAAAVDGADGVAAIDAHIGTCHLGLIAATVEFFDADSAIGAVGGFMDGNHGDGVVGGVVASAEDLMDGIDITLLGVGAIDIDLDGALRRASHIVAAVDATIDFTTINGHLHRAEDTGGIRGLAQTTAIERALDNTFI